jgi:OAA-family lectin sugar binding domain
MATYDTQIQWGGPNAPWHDHADLEIPKGETGESREIDLVPPEGGTQISWGGPDAGAANITFFEDGNRFDGSAQFPGKGPVGYRGTLKD